MLTKFPSSGIVPDLLHVVNEFNARSVSVSMHKHFY